MLQSVARIRELLEKDVIARVFTSFLPRVLYYRSRGIVPFSDQVDSLDRLAVLIAVDGHAFYFNTYEVYGNDKTGIVLVDVDCYDTGKLRKVMDALTPLVGDPESVPMYFTRRGIHFYMFLPCELDRARVRAYFSRMFKGVRIDGNFDAPNVRVPFSRVALCDVRRVVPYQGGVSDTLKAQYDLSLVERVYEKPFILPESVVKEIEELQLSLEEAGVKLVDAIYPVAPPCVLYAMQVAKEKHHLTHDQRVFVASFLKRVLGEDLGRVLIHGWIRYCDDYDPNITDRRYRLVSDRFTYSCRKIREMGLCPYENPKVCPFYKALYKHFI